MIKPLLHNSFFMGFGSLANALINEATIPGRDLALTVVGGGRRSVFDPSVDIASNTPDINSNYEIMVSDGATNLVAAEPSNFSDNGTSTVITPQGDGVERVEMPVASATYLLHTFTPPGAGVELTVSFDIKNNGGHNVVNVRLADDLFGTNEVMSSDETITNDWQCITLSGTAVATTATLLIRDTTNPGEDVDCLIRNIRLHASAIRHPGHTIGSGASDVYPTDVVTCTPTWGSVGTIFQVATPYGWTQWTNNPSNTNARTFYENSLFETFGQISGVDINIIGNNVAGYPTDNIISTLSADWNGVYTGVRYDNVSRVSASNSYTPSSALTIGNRDLIERPFHGPIITLIFNRVLSDAEYNILRAHYIGILANRTL